MSNRKVTVENKKRGAILEVRLRRGMDLQKQTALVYGAYCKVQVPRDCHVQCKETNIRTGKTQPWQTVLRATPGFSPGQKSTRSPQGRKLTKPKPKKKTPRKKAAKKKPAKKKGKKNPSAAVKKVGRKLRKCSICGARVMDVFKHRWDKHPAEQRKSLEKSLATRRRNRRKKKRGKKKNPCMRPIK